MYPALHRLERAGLVQANWSTAGPAALLVTGPVVGLLLLAAQLAIAPGKLSPVLAAVAAVASAVRLTLARRAARRCLALRAGLG